jgi:hypothetical protein
VSCCLLSLSWINALFSISLTLVITISCRRRMLQPVSETVYGLLHIALSTFVGWWCILILLLFLQYSWIFMSVSMHAVCFFSKKKTWKWDRWRPFNIAYVYFMNPFLKSTTPWPAIEQIAVRIMFCHKPFIVVCDILFHQWLDIHSSFLFCLCLICSLSGTGETELSWWC